MELLIVGGMFLYIFIKNPSILKNMFKAGVVLTIIIAILSAFWPFVLLLALGIYNGIN